MKIKKVLLPILMLFLAYSVSAQCYTRFRDEGIKKYNNGNYEKAIEFFNEAKDCPDKPGNGNSEIATWKGKCANAQSKQN